jgi:DNA-damage-inducible protein D
LQNGILQSNSKCKTNSNTMDNQLTPFENKAIRKVWHLEQWYFSVIDVIEVLTDSPNPRNYWSMLKRKDNQLYTIPVQLKIMSLDGKKYKTDCTNTEGIFRIIMSVPSPKVEPLKLWLAEQGKRTLDETETPELLTQRQIELYRLKGRSDEWIKERMKTITTRNELTDEWKNRGVKGNEYSILTAIIAKGTFGLNPSEHKKIKGLEKPSQDLRDHMTDLELIFTALGEATTRHLAIKEDAKGFIENKDKAVKGGKAAGASLDTFEAATGLKVVSSENFLPPPKKTDTLPTTTEPKE